MTTTCDECVWLAEREREATEARNYSKATDYRVLIKRHPHHENVTEPMGART